MVIPAKKFPCNSRCNFIIRICIRILTKLFFDKGHRIRELGLIDNSYNEKRIPNYNSEPYYNNSIMIKR